MASRSDSCRPRARELNITYNWTQLQTTGNNWRAVIRSCGQLCAVVSGVCTTHDSGVTVIAAGRAEPDAKASGRQGKRTVSPATAPRPMLGVRNGVRSRLAAARVGSSAATLYFVGER